ncbi:MAG: PAS domain-containing sensor histidine kinase [Clostridium sp.]|uniref:sensor histidine kinase n=1 Tax=Clostridium sp. TaxID=1506 RepID=UPI0039E9C8B3
MKYTLKAIKKLFFCSNNNFITKVSRDFVDFSGYSEDELVGKSLNEISMLLRIDSVVNLEDIKDKFEGYMFTKQCNAREVTIICKYLEGNNKREYYFREKPNSRIEDKMMFVAQICKNDKIGTAIWSFPDFIMLNCNNKFLNYFYPSYAKRENCIGKYKKEIVNGIEDDNIDKIWSAIKRTGESYHINEFKHEDKVNGTSYWNLIFVPIYVDNNIKYVVENKWDITEKILGRELRDKQSKIIENHMFIDKQYKILNRVIEELDLPVLRFSYPDLKLLDINKKAYSFLKLENSSIDSISSIKGMNYKDIVNSFDKDYILKHVKSIIEKNKMSYSKYRKFTILGEEKFVNTIYQPVFGINNEAVEIVAIGIDVTEEIMANREMKKTLKVQEEIFANLSHEMRTPLNVIFSAVQLIELYLNDKSFCGDKERFNRNIHSIKKNCYRLSRIINNMVDLSRIKLGDFEVNLSNENIVSMLRNIVKDISEYFKGKDVNIVFNTDIDEKIIAYDANNICRAILNLISNAIKFSENSGEISIELRDKNDFIEIFVKDKGIGIEKGNLQNIFEKFKQVDKSFQRNTEGIGIGLYIVKSIVELHYGNISVKSKLGEGSIFKVTLPARTVETNNNRNILFSDKMIKAEFSDIYL